MVLEARSEPHRSSPGPRLQGVLRGPRSRAAEGARGAVFLKLGGELLELPAAAPDEVQLAADVPQQLLEDPSSVRRRFGLGQLSPQMGASRLRLQQRGQLLKREPEQIAQADDLRDALHVGRGVGAVLALLPSGGGAEQPELLPVPDRARRRAGELSELTDSQRPLAVGRIDGRGIALARRLHPARIRAGRGRQPRAEGETRSVTIGLSVTPSVAVGSSWRICT